MRSVSVLYYINVIPVNESSVIPCWIKDHEEQETKSVVKLSLRLQSERAQVDPPEVIIYSSPDSRIHCIRKSAPTPFNIT